MIKKIAIAIVATMVLTGCQTVRNAAESLADKGNRYAIEQNIGKNYKEVADKKDWSIERNKIIGDKTGSEKLASGNTVYFHEKRQESPSSANIFGVISLGDKHVRYDHYAFLVSPAGKILDYAHRRSNTKFSHIGYDTGTILTEIAGDEEDNKDLKQIEKFITSKGKSINTWK